VSAMIDGVLARHTDDQTQALVSRELTRQIAKWGVQAHPDHTGAGWNAAGQRQDGNHFAGLADLMKQVNDRHVAEDTLSWSTILQEEVYEALAESDPAALVDELVQVAAVAVAWVRDIVTRESLPQR
jgi:hypothetical protein